MEGRSTRKWLPTEAYRLLVLRALLDGPSSKARLAREVRANHYVITKVLRELVAADHVEIKTTDKAHDVAATEDGLSFLRQHVGSLPALYGEQMRAHFAYGRVPRWAKDLIR